MPTCFRWRNHKNRGICGIELAEILHVILRPYWLGLSLTKGKPGQWWLNLGFVEIIFNDMGVIFT